VNRDILLASLMILLAATSILPDSAKAYITETSSAYAKIDVYKKCDNNNTNATMSCFKLGIQGGLIDGTQDKNAKVGYSIINGCKVQMSANYCAGYIEGYSKSYGHYPNAKEYFNIVNSTASNDAQAYNALPTKDIICNASPSFCITYLNAYGRVFPSNTVAAVFAAFTVDNFFWVLEKFGVVALASAIIMYWVAQRNDRNQKEKEKRERFVRARDALLAEIDHNKTIFIDKSGYFPHIRRENGIDYFAVSFASAAYESILNSAEYLSFKPETQLALSKLHARIKITTEQVTYLNHYFDEITLHGNYNERAELCLKNMRRYEEFLTQLSKEISQLLDASEKLINSENQ
jgi:hypothetical protein